MGEVLLELRGLGKQFSMGGRGTLRAVRGVNLMLRRGESLGIVGESGCGKSTIARMIAQLTDPTDHRAVYKFVCI